MIAQAEVTTIVATLGATIATLAGLVVWGAKYFATKLFGSERNGGGAVGQFLHEMRELRASVNDLRAGVNELHGVDLRNIEEVLQKHTNEEGDQHRAMLEILGQLAAKE